jgi:hypothetical protein
MNNFPLPRALAALCISLCVFSTGFQAQSPAGGLTTTLNGNTFGPGDVMVVTATLTPLPTPRPVDAYIVVQLPNGVFLSLQLGGGLVPGIVPLARSIVPFSYAAPVAQYAFTGAEPLGTYTWYSALAEPNTLNLVTFHQTPFTVALTNPDAPPSVDEDEQLSTATISLGGELAEDSSNAAGDDVTFQIANGFFSDTVALYLNGDPIPAGTLLVSPTSVTASGILIEGRNALTLVARDTLGATIYQDFVLWAGNSTLTGIVRDENGAVAPGVEVTAKLGDNQAVQQTVTTNNAGQFEFTNLPDRTIIVEGYASNNRIASIATRAGEGPVDLELLSIQAPSPIANNDFSQGESGWSTGSAPVTLVPHDEGDAPFDSQPLTAQAGANMDLLLSTSGEGPQTISRTFQIQPGTQNVRVRYRFITEEVPGGYFGTQFNDYFNVSIRSRTGGGVVTESASMNGLGLAAFDSRGATAWRQTTLPVSVVGDTVQVDLTVANVSDGLLDSELVIDFVDEKTLSISALALKDIDGSPLTHLSADSHTYFGGNTRVHGTVTVKGANGDSLSSLALEIVQDGVVVATANLTAAAGTSLLKPFGPGKQVAIASSQLLFELPAAQAAAVNGAADGTLTLRARARSAAGEEVTKDLGNVQLLVKFDGANRYPAGGPRDEAEGGDDWARPSLNALISSYTGLIWGDFSNMNGGRFPPHSSHDEGLDADGWFPGYNARDAATAATIIGHLNAANGSQITTVFVTYEEVPSDPFWQAIKDVVLNDGRLARAVIRPAAGHTTHFHWRKN